MIYEAGSDDFIKSIIGDDNIAEFTKLTMTCGINKINLGTNTKVRCAAFQLYVTKLEDGELYDLDGLEDDTLIFLSPKSIIDMLDIMACMMDILMATKIISETSKNTFIDKFISMGNKNALIKYSVFKDHLENSTMSFFSVDIAKKDNEEFFNIFKNTIVKVPFLRGNALDTLISEANKKAEQEVEENAESSNES